jgi:NTP pyrophosphatase (non-canonical NTP hydrolase)
MTWNLTFTGYDQTRTERINHLVNQIKYVPNDSDHQIAEIEEILTAISILMNLTDEEYQEEVDLTYDKFSEYLYEDLEFKD